MDFLRSRFFKNEPLIIQIRFSCNQNIGVTIFLHWVSVSPMFLLQENLIWMKEMGNWSEVHPLRNNFLKNPYFSDDGLIALRYFTMVLSQFVNKIEEFRPLQTDKQKSKPIIANFQNVVSCGSPSSIYSWFITFCNQD